MLYCSIYFQRTKNGGTFLLIERFNYFVFKAMYYINIVLFNVRLIFVLLGQFCLYLFILMMGIQSLNPRSCNKHFVFEMIISIFQYILNYRRLNNVVFTSNRNWDKLASCLFALAGL